MHERVDKPLLVRRVAARTGYDVKLVRAVTDAVLEEIAQALEAGDSVSLRPPREASARVAVPVLPAAVGMKVLPARAPAWSGPKL